MNLKDKAVPFNIKYEGMITKKLWIGVDGDNEVYIYDSKPVWHSKENQYQPSRKSGSALRLEGAEDEDSWAYKLKPKDIYLFTLSTDKDEMDEENCEAAMEILSMFIKGGQISLFEADENTDMIKSTCYKLAKAFVEK